MKKLKELLNGLFKITFVKKCIACESLLEYDREYPLCESCASEWEDSKREVCGRCLKSHVKCRCGFGKLYVDSVRHLALYDSSDKSSVVNRIVYSLKKRNNEETFDFVAKEMADNLINKNKLNNTVIVSVPRSPKSIRHYGYDHAKKLSVKLSRLLDTEYVNILGHRGGSKEQKALNLHQRELNARNHCFIKQDMVEKIKGKNILLVDDIGTTGAMTGVCAELLHNNGALRVDCILAARNKIKRKL